MQKIVKFVRLIDPLTGVNGEWVAYEDSSDTVCVGIRTEDGYFQYDSYEVYHVSGWAAGLGLEAQFHEVTVQLPD